MDSKEAKLKLSDWVEYLSNTRQGSYKTVELEYEDAQEIAELITQQDKIIELACKTTARHCCYPGQDCPAPLPLPCSDCWRKYLQGEVSK